MAMAILASHSTRRAWPTAAYPLREISSPLCSVAPKHLDLFLSVVVFVLVVDDFFGIQNAQADCLIGRQHRGWWHARTVSPAGKPDNGVECLWIGHVRVL